MGRRPRLAHRPRPALRLVPLQRHRQDVVRPARGDALGGLAAHHLEGGGGHVPPAAARRCSWTRSSATRACRSSGPTSTTWGSSRGSPRRCRLDATLYYLRRHDMPSDRAAPAPTAASSATPPTGGAAATGWRCCSSTVRPSDFYGWIAYTLSRSEDRRLTARRQAGRPPRPYRPTQFDQTHNLVVVASRQLGTAWELGAALPAGDRRARDAGAGRLWTSDYGDWDPVSGEPTRSAGRPSTSWTCASSAPSPSIRGGFGVYLDVQNVYNAENPEATLYDYRFRESGPVRGLPILPMLGLRGGSDARAGWPACCGAGALAGALHAGVREPHHHEGSAAGGHHGRPAGDPDRPAGGDGQSRPAGRRCRRCC